MLDTNFDPYQALVNLDANMQKLIQAHNLLAHEVENHAKTLDVLIKGLDAANQANQALLTEHLHTISAKYSTQGQH